jgi:thioester reductase-like protein
LAQRVIATCEAGYQAAEQVRRDAEQAQRASAASFRPIYSADEAGNQTRINPRDISLPVVELRKWEAKVREVAESHRLQALLAKQALDEELAVLRMFAPDLTSRCDYVSRTAGTVPKYIGQYEPVLSQAITDLNAAIAQLWRTATGETDDERS